jgi:hypothetical protein
MRNQFRAWSEFMLPGRVDVSGRDPEGGALTGEAAAAEKS